MTIIDKQNLLDKLSTLLCFELYNSEKWIIFLNNSEQNINCDFRINFNKIYEDNFIISNEDLNYISNKFKEIFFTNQSKLKFYIDNVDIKINSMNDLAIIDKKYQWSLVAILTTLGLASTVIVPALLYDYGKLYFNKNSNKNYQSSIFGTIHIRRSMVEPIL